MSGSPSAGRTTGLVFALAVGFTIASPTPSVLAQAPGGFVEKADSTAIRTPWTASRIQAFLPPRGQFTFPAPYNTEGVRLTNSTDCGGTDCVMSPGYSHINNHRGSDTMLIVLGLRGVGPTLFSYGKITDRVVKVGPLFDPSSPYASSSGEGWYFSATQPRQLYVTGALSPKLLRYDVQAKTFQTVFDATSQFGEGKYVWQAHSSDDDNVHSATLRDLPSHAMLGCLAYREDARQFFYYAATEGYGECQIDKSGRWLSIKEDLDGVPGRDDLIVDLETGTEKILLGADAAGGTSDIGDGNMVAADKRPRGPGAMRVWNFDQDPPDGPVVYYTAAGTAGAARIARSNAKPGAARGQQYACAANATRAVAPRANEIVCFRLDSSLDVLVVSQSMTDLNAPGGGVRAQKLPKGNLDVTGSYFVWVSNMGGDRADAFMVKVPAQLMTRSPEPTPGVPATEARPDTTRKRYPAVPVGPAGGPDPTLLPVATTAQIPLTAAYNALNVPSLVAGGWYLDPTTRVRIYKLTSSTFPTSSASWGHDYAEGGNEVSLPYNGNTRAVLVYRWNGGGGHWLVDFTPGVGVSNPRQLTGNLSPLFDVGFTFSSNPATPYYAYVGNGSSIVRFDLRTMTEVPGNGWPVTGESNTIWLHQSENDGMFVWMRGPSGPTVAIFEPSTNTKKTYTNANVNEPRIDRGGRYVGLVMNSPSAGLFLYDWNTNSIVWTTDGMVPFGHIASLKHRWYGIDWNLSTPCEFAMWNPLTQAITHLGGPANTNIGHVSANWNQNPPDLNDQWAVSNHYESLVPTGNGFLAPGGMVLITANGQRRLLGHSYNTTATYEWLSFAKFSPDGKFVLFTSDMNGSPRSDVFLAQVPDI